VRRRLGHTPGIAGGAHTPAFAGEGHQEVAPAVATAGAGKAVGEDAAFQVFGKRFAYKGLGAAVVALPVKLARAGQVKPGLVVLGHCLVEQCVLGVARVVALGLTGSGHAYCANTQHCASAACACHHPACSTSSKTAPESFPGPFLGLCLQSYLTSSINLFFKFCFCLSDLSTSSIR